MGKYYVVIDLWNGRLSLCTQLKLIIIFRPLLIFLSKWEEKASLMFAKDFIFMFNFADKQGVSAIFSTSNSGESTIFSSGRRPWIIFQMWLYVYLPSRAIALSQVTTSQCHTDTSNLAFSSSPDLSHGHCSFSKWPAARSPPKSRHAFNHRKLTGSELYWTLSFLRSHF